MTVLSAVSRKSVAIGRGTEDGDRAPLMPPTSSLPKSSFASPSCVVIDAVTDAAMARVMVRLSLLRRCTSSAWDLRVVGVADDVEAAGISPGVARAAFRCASCSWRFRVVEPDDHVVAKGTALFDCLDSSISEPDKTTETPPAGGSGPPDCWPSSDIAITTTSRPVIKVLEKATLEEVVLDEVTAVLRADEETALRVKRSAPDALIDDDDDDDDDDGLVYVTMILAEGGRLVELVTDEK